MRRVSGITAGSKVAHDFEQPGRIEVYTDLFSGDDRLRAVNAPAGNRTDKGVPTIIELQTIGHGEEKWVPIAGRRKIDYFRVARGQQGDLGNRYVIEANYYDGSRKAPFENVTGDDKFKPQITEIWELDVLSTAGFSITKAVPAGTGNFQRIDTSSHDAVTTGKKIEAANLYLIHFAEAAAGQQYGPGYLLSGSFLLSLTRLTAGSEASEGNTGGDRRFKVRSKVGDVNFYVNTAGILFVETAAGGKDALFLRIEEIVMTADPVVWWMGFGGLDLSTRKPVDTAIPVNATKLYSVQYADPTTNERYEPFILSGDQLGTLTPISGPDDTGTDPNRRIEVDVDYAGISQLNVYVGTNGNLYFQADNVSGTMPMRVEEWTLAESGPVVLFPASGVTTPFASIDTSSDAPVTTNVMPDIAKLYLLQLAASATGADYGPGYPISGAQLHALTRLTGNESDDAARGGAKRLTMQTDNFDDVFVYMAANNAISVQCNNHNAIFLRIEEWDPADGVSSEPVTYENWARSDVQADMKNLSVNRVNVETAVLIGGGSENDYGAINKGSLLAKGEVIANISDKRLKSEVAKIENALEALAGLDAVVWEPNDRLVAEGWQAGQKHYGLYAQDVEAVLPEAVRDSAVSDDDARYRTVLYDKLVPVLVAALKEQQDINRKLEKRIEAVEGGEEKTS